MEMVNFQRINWYVGGNPCVKKRKISKEKTESKRNVKNFLCFLGIAVSYKVY